MFVFVINVSEGHLVPNNRPKPFRKFEERIARSAGNQYFRRINIRLDVTFRETQQFDFEQPDANRLTPHSFDKASPYRTDAATKVAHRVRIQ